MVIVAVCVVAVVLLPSLIFQLVFIGISLAAVVNAVLANGKKY